MTNVAEFQKKDAAELEKSIREMKKKLSDLRQNLAASRLKNPNEIRLIKKDIARILTILSEKKNA